MRITSRAFQGKGHGMKERGYREKWRIWIISNRQVYDAFPKLNRCTPFDLDKCSPLVKLERRPSKLAFPY